MKVLLVKPTQHTDSITPPLGLGYLAGALRPAHEVSILDGPKIGLNAAKFEKYLRDLKPDAVGFNVVSLDLFLTAKYLSLVRKILPDAITIVGGPHPSGEPDETFDTYAPDLDYGFVGEAEKGLRLLLDMLESGKPSQSDLKTIPGLIWKDGPETRWNPMYLEQYLDSLDFPAWDLMPPGSYPNAPHAAFAKGFPVGTISATRGCPFLCLFCAARNVQGAKIRRRSVANLMEEIDLLVNKYGIKELHLVDDNFTYNREYAFEFCENLSSKFPKLAWTCPNGVRLDSLDEKLLAAMKRSGCHVLAVGIESGSQSVLDSVKKKQTIDLVRNRVDMMKKAGIDPVGFFGFGFPGETKEEMRNTIEFSLSLPLIRAQYMFFHPMPGTEQYRKILREEPQKLRALYTSLEKIAYVENGITEAELKWMQRSAFLRFYLRPSRFFKLVSSIRNPNHAYYIGKRIIRWMVMG